ncbi:AN1-type zinc finger protein 4 [Aphanomyces cochlioides]|nr:AN1-type zinc finger protein 4 [Aphanomyces cochlioides]
MPPSPLPPKLLSLGRPAIDRDILYEVLCVYLEGEEKKAEYTETGLTLGLGVMEAATASSKQQARDGWMMEMLNPDKPMYGFDEVVDCLEKKSTVQPNKRKCWTCRAKLGLATVSCKCGYTFCRSHRYPEMHQCRYDYKRENKRKLELLNPALRPDKLVRV